jgi:hypothetical protein
LLSSISTSSVAMCCTLTSSDEIRWHITHNSLTTLQTSWIVRHQSSRKASCTFAIFSIMVLVECHPLTLCTINWHLFFERLNHV